MRTFRQFLENKWFPTRSIDPIHDQDSPPQRTPEGDYVVYHGTNRSSAARIIKERRLLPDDIHAIGFATHPTRADMFGSMKAKKNNPSVLLRIVIDKNWLDQQDISREVGGSGRDQFLINYAEEVPPAAIKDIQVARVSGTPLKGGSLEYQG